MQNSISLQISILNLGNKVLVNAAQFSDGHEEWIRISFSIIREAVENKALA